MMGNRRSETAATGKKNYAQCRTSNGEHSRVDPFPDRPDGSGFALGGNPIALIELLFSASSLQIQRAEKFLQSFSSRALPDETAPDSFVFVKSADVSRTSLSGQLTAPLISSGEGIGGTDYF